MRVGCQRPPTWRVCVRVNAVGKPELKLQFGLLVCGGCREKTTIDDVISDDGWLQMMSQFDESGLCRPDRGSARIDFDPLLETTVEGETIQ